MINLKDLDLKKAYDSDSNDILSDFYIPALSNSIKYRRLAGFFSSTSLAVAARGISRFIANGGHMDLICGAKLSKADVEAIKEAHENPAAIIERFFFENLEDLENEFIRDHVRALGWMIANKKLDIKISIVYNEEGCPLDEKTIEKQGIFHQKVGIFEDAAGNMVSFSGSTNESAMGWLKNIEEFKVFRSWIESEEEYLTADKKRFEKFWNGIANRIEIIEIPIAIKEKLIEIAPPKIADLNLEKWLEKTGTLKKTIKLWKHQIQAITNWQNNDRKGIFEMATGTGKTFAALGCLKRVLKDEKKLVIVITCPYGHLVKQWLDDINEFGIFCDTIIADSSSYGWKDKLMDNILDIKNGISEKLIVLTTHVTFSMNDFIKIIRKVNVEIFLIADEVHGVGAPERKRGLIENYRFRLGLSATPKRWFDLEGTEELFDYFGGTVFEFPLKKAINTINTDTGRTFLVPYEYKPYFIELTNEELNEYERETKKIAKAYYRSKDKEERDKWFSLLLIKRQKIIKNAVNKFNAFKEILDDIEEIKDCLVYCSPQQIDEAQDILNSYKRDNIIQHKFTNKEGVVPEDKYGGISEREFLLQQLAEGKYHALIAMKCLDEGVDVPPVKMAIILASTGNPRQYIQRRGRILRRFPGKEKAIIYDVIVVPTFSGSVDLDFLELEKKILKKELKRYKEFAYIAINAVECLNKIEGLEDKYNIII